MYADTLLLKTLTMLSEPVIVVKRGRIDYMNRAASAMLGSNSEGELASAVLPQHIINIQAESFVTTAVIGGVKCTVRAVYDDCARIFVLSTHKHAVKYSSLLFSGMRTELANVKLASNCINSIAELGHDDRLMDYATTLNRSYYKLKHSIDNISTLSAISNNELPFSPEALDIVELFRSATGFVSIMMEKQGINVSFHSEDSIRITADKALIEQLLLNLLSNSITHCTAGCHISVSLLRSDKGVIISVDDDGDGIAAENLPFVLDRYNHDFELSDIAKGSSGLGLSIVRGIAEMHGGTTIIESRGVGKGASVRVMLSDSTKPHTLFSSPEPAYSTGDTVMLLTELSDCLPAECYSNIFED